MHTRSLIETGEQYARNENQQLTPEPKQLRVRALLACFSLCLLVGCQSSSAISRTEPSKFHFTRGERAQQESIDFAEATMLEKSPEESASDSSWKRIFGRFRSKQSASDSDTQPVNELPRTDIDEADPDTVDAPASFDTGF